MSMDMRVQDPRGPGPDGLRRPAPEQVLVVSLRGGSHVLYQTPTNPFTHIGQTEAAMMAPLKRNDVRGIINARLKRGGNNR
jgi:hypothetical protein